MAKTEAKSKAGTASAHDESEAHPTPDAIRETAAETLLASMIADMKQLEARVALAEASATIYKAQVQALRPKTSSFEVIQGKIKGKNTGLANSLKLNPEMLDAMADSHPMLKIDTLYSCQKKDEALAEQTREVYALITLLLDTMTTEDAKQLKEMLADVLAETNTWEDANKVVDNKCRDDSKGLPGLYRLVGRLCQGAVLEENQIEVYQYVKVAAVTAVAILLTKPLV